MLLLAFIVGGLLAELRGRCVCSRDRYQVSTLGLNLGGEVSPAVDRMWQARFVREDALFTTFGVFELAAGVVVLLVRRRARLAAAGASSPSDQAPSHADPTV